MIRINPEAGEVAGIRKENADLEKIFSEMSLKNRYENLCKKVIIPRQNQEASD